MQAIPILIIDDSEADRYIIKRKIRETELPINVSEEINGKAGLKYFEDKLNSETNNSDKFPPVFIFLDINMPLMNGFEFLDKFSELRKCKRLESCVVMMFSSSETEEDIDKAMSYDFVAEYLVKGSYSAIDLKEKITSGVKNTNRGV